jgi:hypothetical protein
MPDRSLSSVRHTDDSVTLAIWAPVTDKMASASRTSWPSTQAHTSLMVFPEEAAAWKRGARRASARSTQWAASGVPAPGRPAPARA